ncbi:MAG: methyltransferase domain-containing protein [Deltaproteobacteria bacterium]|nr:methyltransferase domain-containing protein [Deltaproteobacteria bacterium]
MDRMPGFAFQVMKMMFDIRDRFVSVSSLLDEFGIEPGQTVVDYGCGPGSYLKRASKLVGPQGRVFALDIHELAIRAVTKRAAQERLTNVTAVLTDRNKCSLAGGIADIIYALDMFHMVSDPGGLMGDLNRISKRSGFLFIDNGHQSRDEARTKIIDSGLWEMVEEKKRYMKWRPLPYDKRF